MTPGAGIRGDLERGAWRSVVGLAEQLERERPAPSVRFSGELRRHLLEREPGVARSAGLALRIASYAGAGVALLMIGAVSVAGLGPLAA